MRVAKRLERGSCQMIIPLEFWQKTAPVPAPAVAPAPKQSNEDEDDEQPNKNEDEDGYESSGDEPEVYEEAGM